MTKQGIVLFAHGSRDPLWRLPVEAVAEAIRARDPDALACCAYLEMCGPGLVQAATDLIAAGACRIRIFPLFIGVGKHAREDLPLLMAELGGRHPGVPMELMAAAGEHPALTALMAEIALA